MRITNPAKRLSAAVVAIAATTVFAASTSAHQTLVVHTHRDRSGTVLVTGYDGGAPLAPTR
jgi:hypothetical protein